MPDGYVYEEIYIADTFDEKGEKTGEIWCPVDEFMKHFGHILKDPLPKKIERMIEHSKEKALLWEGFLKKWLEEGIELI